MGHVCTPCSRGPALLCSVDFHFSFLSPLHLLSSDLPLSIQMVGNRGKESAGICLVQSTLRQHHVGGKELFQAPCFFPLQGHFLPCSRLQNLPLKILGTKKGILTGLFTESQQPLHPKHVCVQVREHQTNTAPNCSQRQGLLSTLPVLVG